MTSDDQMGEQAYQSYHGGDIDSVSLTNGTLTLNFPFLSYPQRGKLHLDFHLMYNNQPQHQGQLCAGPTNTCLWQWGYPSGGAFPVERGDVYVGWGQQMGLVGQFIPLVYMDGSIITEVELFSNWSLQMADGSKHPLGNMGGTTLTTNGWCGASGYESPLYTCLTANGPFETLDATGRKVNGALNPCLVQSGCYYPYLPSGMTAVDSDGLIYGNENSSVQDPNGNEIISNAGGLLDSLGRQIPLPPTSGSSGNTNTSNCPVISGQPGVSQAVLWSPPIYNGGTQQYIFCYSNGYTKNLPATHNFRCYAVGATLLQSIVLPNGQSWQFQYNDPDPGVTCGGQAANYTTLSQITLPTGGTISYTYNYAGSTTYSPPVSEICQNYGRWVATRTVNANDGTGAHTWTYTYNGNNTIVTDPLQNDTVHTFGAGSTCELFETQTQYYQGRYNNGGTLLKTVNTTYSGATSRNVLDGVINEVPTSVQTVWQEGGGPQPTTQVTKSYDSGFPYRDYTGNINGFNGPNVGIYGKVLSEQDYDYPAGTSLLRTITTQYEAFVNSNYLNENLLNLPSSVSITGAGGNSSSVSYGYDGYPLASTGASLTPESYPGNQTSIQRQLNGNTTAGINCPQVTSGYLLTKKVYYNTGEVQSVTDPCTYQTTYQYGTSNTGAFPTTVTNALNQSTSYTYDSNNLAVTSIQDPNQQTTTKNYDSLTRLISVSYPDGGSTTYCYTDGTPSNCPTGDAGSNPFAVVVTKAITSSKNEVSSVVVDGLGRLSQTQLNSDPTGNDFTLVTYDALGRKSQVYNPTRCSTITSNCKSETTWGYTTINYDPLSRVTSVVEQDGSSLSTSYANFPCTTVTDEIGNSRQSCVDGLGRMTSVIEDPGSPAHLNYSTTYAYDALGNLTGVTQNGSNSGQARTRSFAYDSLSELTSAQNPESGTITYAYDADSNVITKTAPSPNQPSNGTATVATTYAYDKLNRLTGKSYVDGYTSNPATAQALFGYDGTALTGCTTTPPSNTDSYPVGRRTSICDGSGAAAWSHDKMGRILKERRTIGSVSGEYDNDSYNLDGSVATMTALGYAVSYSYNAAGQVLNVENSSDPFNFAVSATYAPPGEATSMKLGASGAQITVTNAYNSRLQPILLSAANSSGTSLFSECFDFHLGAAINTTPCSFSAYSTGDNGNVYSILNNRDNTRTQNFAYDPLNRIWQAYTTGTQWGETYSTTAYAPGTAFTSSTAGIDSWGNLTHISAVTGKTNHEGLSQSATINNQLTGFTYDAAGNMTVDGSATYFYDAENRLIATAGTSYIYDGDGDRVEKCTEGTTPGTCSSGATGTMYWRGTSPDPQAETDLSGNVLENYIFFNGQRIARREPTKTVHFYFSDHLGSHGVVVNSTGTTFEQDIDYYPYGGQENDYSPNVAQHYKFTGKERDSESGLDMFGARYYGSSLGRFMTPDWEAKPTDVPYANFGNPQSLNLYSYVENNPTTTGDPDGHCPPCALVLEGLAEEGAIAAWNYVAGAGVLGLTGAAAGATPKDSGGFVSPGQPSYYHGELQNSDGTSIYMRSGESGNASTQSAQSGQTSQSTPAQPPDDGGGKDTTRAARREAMRQEGIPTSQQPSSQTSTDAGRQYTYEVPKEGGGTQTKIVTNQLKDENHGPHVEAGAPKANGQTDPSGRLRHANPKTKVDVNQ